MINKTLFLGLNLLAFSGAIVGSESLPGLNAQGYAICAGGDVLHFQCLLAQKFEAATPCTDLVCQNCNTLVGKHACLSAKAAHSMGCNLTGNCKICTKALKS